MISCKKISTAIEKILRKVAKGIIQIYVIPHCESKVRERRKIETKLKYFNPVIKETFWGKSITWIGREKPLTDEQLKEYYKQ